MTESNVPGNKYRHNFFNKGGNQKDGKQVILPAPRIESKTISILLISEIGERFKKAVQILSRRSHSLLSFSTLSVLNRLYVKSD